MKFFLFVAPLILGDDGARSSFSGNRVSKIRDSHKFEVVNLKKMERDILVHLIPKGEN